jgi:hypothetical protein
MVDRRFQVREYYEFPFKRETDPVVGEDDEKIKHARFRALALSRKHPNRRFYVWDIPHEYLTLEDIELTEKAKKAIMWD